MNNKPTPPKEIIAPPADARIVCAGATAPKRSLKAPIITVGVIAAAAYFIGYPMLQDATSQPVQRNKYADQQSCQCDYGENSCTKEGNQWLGPWYAKNAEDRQADDPGPGRTCPQENKGSNSRAGAVAAGLIAGRMLSGAGGNSAQAAPMNNYQPPRGYEQGNRGGFGNSSSRVRSAGS